MKQPRRLLISAAMVLAAVPGLAHEDPDAHAAPNAAARTAVSASAHYTVPGVRLIRDDGAAVMLPAEMNDGRAVVLNFIFTSCGSTCPLMSAMLSQFQQQLGPDIGNVHLMSISVDPEEDTPARLREYARKFHAGPHWQHYTGTVDASLAVQKAFNVWRGDKMSHAPVTFIRIAPDQPWLRVEGFVLPSELLQDYRNLRPR
ncbi:MAG: SCO family protein [Sinobacteraceae bacterium]|nr:SCO family protein [Nevskiaceae bacterium]